MSNSPATCRCGCGETPSPGSEWPPGGHDHRAVHQRIARIGSTVEFCDWFDQQVPPAAPSSSDQPREK
ncbi:hypothetical protein AB0G60_02425 [Streptomyces angustmyceticus]|uniref:Uncharacterized protein n=1 Tax=Streptomyces angustmyceticus TaxID=285578 RepID=A0A5J4L1G3_9ACTN|nr:hypothetical protein [Streptomyces angustmyceticus]UAL65518.1 hypothetical protein K7396_02400 [Streptomyces angustmyceticus]GES27963.1 hypothetical protein San01_04500 [Streptomyces angustmyceticus]